MLWLLVLQRLNVDDFDFFVSRKKMAKAKHVCLFVCLQTATLRQHKRFVRSGGKKLSLQLKALSSRKTFSETPTYT